MSTAEQTQKRLLVNARRLIWERGYSNVSLREIASAAGCDVALVSRYFGSKMGLFNATLKDNFASNWISATTPDELVDQITKVFVFAPRDDMNPSVLKLLVMNASDEQVGERVRKLQRETFQGRINEILGSEAKGALFVSVIIGISVAEKTLRLDGFGDPGSPEYEKQVRHLLASAAAY